MLFPGRGPLPLAGRSQREGDKGSFGLLEREEVMGAGQAPCPYEWTEVSIKVGPGSPGHRQHACLHLMSILVAQPEHRLYLPCGKACMGCARACPYTYIEAPVSCPIHPTSANSHRLLDTLVLNLQVIDVCLC